jgi:hypothetical protein
MKMGRGYPSPFRLFKEGPGPVLELVGGEFQPSFETVYPGGDACLNYGFDAVFLKISKGSPRFY